jgi:hypothetical protein
VGHPSGRADGESPTVSLMFSYFGRVGKGANSPSESPGWVTAGASSRGVALRYATPGYIQIVLSRGGHSSVASKTQTFRSRSAVILGSPPSIDAGETEAIIRAPLLAAFGTPPLLQFLYPYSRKKCAPYFFLATFLF